MGKNEKGISVDTFQQPLFKNGGKVPEARNGVTRLHIRNADKLSILGWKVNRMVQRLW
jgi:hypothetical protein